MYNVSRKTYSKQSASSHTRS